MTTALKTLVALALVCAAAPAFARGGPGGMSMGSSHQPTVHQTGWDIVTNKSLTGNTVNQKNPSTMWNKVSNTTSMTGNKTTGSATGLQFHFRHVERIRRLEAEIRRLFALEAQEKANNNTAAALRIGMLIKHLRFEVIKVGGLG